MLTLGPRHFALLLLLLISPLSPSTARSATGWQARKIEDLPDEETWTARARGRTLTHVMMTLPATPRRRRERVINFVTVPQKKRSERR